MKNFIQDGKVLSYTVPEEATVTSGEVIIVGKVVGVAAKDGAEGDVVAVNTCGVYEIGKTAALEISQGDELFYNTSTDLVTKTTTHVRIGVAWADAAGADTTCMVKFDETGTGGNVAANVAAEATADGSDAATTQALSNALKTKVNAILTALKAGGLMTPDA